MMLLGHVGITLGAVEVQAGGDVDPAEVKRQINQTLGDVYKSGDWLVEKDNAEGQG